MKTKILTLLAILFFTSSCDLELEPFDNVNGAKVWTTAAGNEKMVSGAYSRMRKILTQEFPVFLYGDLPSGSLFKHGHWIAQQATDGKFAGSYMLDYWGNWSPYFQVINTTNVVLNHVNDVPASEFGDEGQKKKDRIRGEAYFIYSFMYFHMVRVYGEVPLVKESIENADQIIQNGSTVPRKQSSEIEILEYILTTTDAAIALLDFDKPGDQGWAVQADRAAALTLKAHILLWLAREPNNHPDRIKFMNEAEQILDLVINSSNRSLVPYDSKEDFEKLFRGKSNEGIFELNFSVADNESYHINAGSGWRRQHGATYRDVSKKQLNNMDFMVAEAGKATTLYSPNDKRRDLFFQNFGNAADDKLAPPFLLKLAVGLEADPNDSEMYFVNSNVILFRLSECILLRAETLHKLGRSNNARDLLNIIRNRAGIGNYTGSTADLEGAIYDERVRELAGEGHSAFDRIRSNYWEGCDWINAERMAKRGYYWPIQLDQLIGANRELYQNPYWAGII